MGIGGEATPYGFIENGTDPENFDAVCTMRVTYCTFKPIVKGSGPYHEMRWNVGKRFRARHRC